MGARQSLGAIRALALIRPCSSLFKQVYTRLKVLERIASLNFKASGGRDVLPLNKAPSLLPAGEFVMQLASKFACKLHVHVTLNLGGNLYKIRRFI
jgi:hypothetical protein